MLRLKALNVVTLRHQKNPQAFSGQVPGHNFVSLPSARADRNFASILFNQ